VLTLAAVFFLVRNRWRCFRWPASWPLTPRMVSGASLTAVPGIGLRRTKGVGRRGISDELLALLQRGVSCRNTKNLRPESRELSHAEQRRVLHHVSADDAAVHTAGFWKFSLGYGVVLLGLAALAR